jgi:PadR family transcriptional regulator, regulatory protein PadR
MNSELIRGHVDTILLALLSKGDSYGYEICKHVSTLSNGGYELKEPTLYSAFRRLEDQGLIASRWGEESRGGRRKYYSITAQGREALLGMVSDWKRARELIDTLLDGIG